MKEKNENSFFFFTMILLFSITFLFILIGLNYIQHLENSICERESNFSYNKINITPMVNKLSTCKNCGVDSETIQELKEIQELRLNNFCVNGKFKK